MDLLALAALAIVGFTTCAEFGSYAFVHPVIRRLPPPHHIVVEQGLLRTFGRVMPIFMPASVLVVVAYALAVTGDGEGAAVTAWGAVMALGAATVSTVAVNVPINTSTARWRRARNRHHRDRRWRRRRVVHRWPVQQQGPRSRGDRRPREPDISGSPNLSVGP